MVTLLSSPVKLKRDRRKMPKPAAVSPGKGFAFKLSDGTLFWCAAGYLARRPGSDFIHPWLFLEEHECAGRA
jgi:hypothetical protein